MTPCPLCCLIWRTLHGVADAARQIDARMIAATGICDEATGAVANSLEMLIEVLTDVIDEHKRLGDKVS